VETRSVLLERASCLRSPLMKLLVQTVSASSRKVGGCAYAALLGGVQAGVCVVSL
jgi:hypothetical protein